MMMSFDRFFLRHCQILFPSTHTWLSHTVHGLAGLAWGCSIAAVLRAHQVHQAHLTRLKSGWSRSACRICWPARGHKLPDAPRQPANTPRRLVVRMGWRWHYRRKRLGLETCRTSRTR